MTIIEPTRYAEQLAQKTAELQKLLSPFQAPALEVFDSPHSHYRMRAEFRLWRQSDQLDYAMFKPDDKRTPVLLEQFPIASQQINTLMPLLKKAWQTYPQLAHKLFQIEFLTTLKGDALVTLCYHKPLDSDWQQIAQMLANELNINLIGRSRKQRLVIGRDYAEEQLTVAGRTYHYQQPEGAFTQPNAIVNTKMLNWAYDALGERNDDLLELYCGNGNFTIPLATRVQRVLATEISKTSVHAALENIKQNHSTNISLARLSSEEFTMALNKVRPFRRLMDIDLDSYKFGTLFVDPPRAGMDIKTCELARRFPRILYISCNPQTLSDNIKQLADSHKISKAALFDQFPYTHHIETGVLLERRT